MKHLRQQATAKLLAAFTTGLMLLTACSSDNVSIGGPFVFTSPGGQTYFDYPADDRKTIRDFAGPDLSGEGSTISATDCKGQVLVINYWGSWCAPCREEVDDLNYAYEMTNRLCVAFLGINIAENARNGLSFAIEKKVPYPSIHDQGRRTLIAFKGVPANVTPVTMILDRQQRVARIFLGKVTLDQLAPEIKAVSAEPPAWAAASTAQAPR